MPDTTEQPERFDLRSHDIAEDKREELLRLFPEARTEGGKVEHPMSTSVRHRRASSSRARPRTLDL